jgi:hypothetical protein
MTRLKVSLCYMSRVNCESADNPHLADIAAAELFLAVYNGW